MLPSDQPVKSNLGYVHQRAIKLWALSLERTPKKAAILIALPVLIFLVANPFAIATENRSIADAKAISIVVKFIFLLFRDVAFEIG